MRPPSTQSRGFTLLEVVIAIAIFAICISTVYGLYGSVLSVIQATEDKTSRNDQVRITFDRIAADLSGVHQSDQGVFKAVEAASAFDEPILEFTSTSHLSFDPTATPVPLAVIRYSLQPDDNNESYTLTRSDTPGLSGNALFGKGTNLRLVEGLQEIELAYFASDGRESSEWDSADRDDEDEPRFPARVAIELVFGTEDDTQERYMTSVLLPPTRIQFGEDDDVQ